MRKRKEVVVTPSIDRSHIVEDFGRKGEIVGVRGQRGSFKILLEALNTRTETEWVELFGGIAGHEQFHAVRPERIVKKRQPRG